MTHQELENSRKKNESLLMDFFQKVNVPVNRAQKIQTINGRNCKCMAIQLICESREEFMYHKNSFAFAVKKGGDFFQYNERILKLVITIKDGWN